MKRVAGTTGGEPIVAIPPVVEPVVVQLALAVVEVQHEHVEVAVRVLPYAPAAICATAPRVLDAGCIGFGIVMPQRQAPSIFIF